MDDDISVTTTAIERATPYARFGLRIFPCHTEDKCPMPGYSWLELASSKINEVVEDFDRAAQLWGDDHVSVGWALGLDDHVAVDLDLPHTEWPQWAIDVSGYAAINITRRGQHLIFKVPQGTKPGNGDTGFPTTGWGEVRGYHGYIIIAGPDRPGLSLSEFDHCQEFPYPDWLREFGGSPDAITTADVIAFANAHSGVGTMPNKVNGIQVFCDNWNPAWEGDPTKGRHPSAVWALTQVADEALDGYYAFKAGYDIVRAWWKRVTPVERHGREWNGLVTWAVSKALMNHQRPETESNASDEPVLDLDDGITLIQFRELPDPFVIPPIEWHAKGLLMQGTHGELGGPEKSLKSYLALATTIAIALGVPVLGHFEVPERQRVLVLSGEGGEVGMLRRVERIASAYGATIGDLRPWLRYTTITAPLTSPLMLDSIRAAVDDFDPAIIWLDPWYAYAPGSAVASSALLTDIGQVLSNWRQAVGVERTAMINHHLNTGGTGDGLQRLAGAGHAEWCDSWMLVDHRERPQVDEGRFRLRLRVGSRQWGGGDYAVDLNVGRFDPEHGVHLGSIHWRVGRLAEAIAETDDERHQAVMTDAQLAIKRFLRKQGGSCGRTELIESAGGRKERTRAALGILIERGEVIERTLKVAGEAGRPRVVCSLVEDQP